MHLSVSQRVLCTSLSKFGTGNLCKFSKRSSLATTIRSFRLWIRETPFPKSVLQSDTGLLRDTLVTYLANLDGVAAKGDGVTIPPQIDCPAAIRSTDSPFHPMTKCAH